jgi:hypothetical protein
VAKCSKESVPKSVPKGVVKSVVKAYKSVVKTSVVKVLQSVVMIENISGTHLGYFWAMLPLFWELEKHCT